MVTNPNGLDDQAAFIQEAAGPNHDGEATEACEAANWTPAVPRA